MREKQPSILVVEDTALTRFSCKRILEGKGYLVEEAASGEEGLLKAGQKTEAYDLIITDIHLPGLNGFSFLERLKADPVYRYVPVMALTSDASFGSVKQAIELGVVEYLCKPFTEEELTRRVEKLVGPGLKATWSPGEVLQEVLAAEVNRAKRGGHSLAVIVARGSRPGEGDISRFEKKIRRRVRNIDTVLALEAGCLVLVLPLTGLAGATVVTTKLKNWLPGDWTFGIAAYPDNGEDGEALLKSAQADLEQKVGQK